MSLLIKALEKAARDRADARVEPAAAVDATTKDPSPNPELTLEPLSNGPSVAKSGSEPQLKASSARVPPTAAPSWNDHDKAAAVLRAGTQTRGGFASYMQAHPIVVLAALAAIFLVSYGIYVYLQVSQPGLFIARPPAPRQAPTGVQSPLTSAPREPKAEEPRPLMSQVVPSIPEPPPMQPAVAPPSPPTPAPAVESPASKPVPTGPKSRIVIKRGRAPAVVPPLLKGAYAALSSGRLETAQRLYEELLRNEPRNIDALLGLAAIAVQENKTDEAVKHYMRILELDPRHALAQAGMIAILGRAEPLAAETRLKLLIARDPSAFLYFTLGNLYADQSRWAQAQQDYFQAYHLEPTNPDYAYNLAVGLEHVGQSKLALDFYRRAVQLASDGNRVNFNLAQAQERIAKLSPRVE